MIGCTIAALGPNSAGSDISALRLSRLAGRHHGLHWMTKTQRNYNGPVLALSSAFLFGASTPIAKLLLGVTDPLLLMPHRRRPAALLFAGLAFGLITFAKLPLFAVSFVLVPLSIAIAGIEKARAR